MKVIHIDKAIIAAVFAGALAWQPVAGFADDSPASRAPQAELHHADLITVPFQSLIRWAAGVQTKKPVPSTPKPGVTPPPELLAAFRRFQAAKLPYEIQEKAFDWQTSYAQHAVESMPWAFGDVRVNDQYVARPVLEPKPMDTQVIVNYEMAFKAYKLAYEKFGDPAARYTVDSVVLPNPTLRIPEDHPPEHNLSPAKVVAVTADNRVLAITSGGKDLKTGRRLWLVDQDKAITALTEGVEVKRDGNVLGRLGSFDALTGNSRGDVMLLARLSSASKPAYERNALMFIWNPQKGLRLVAAPSEPLPELGGGWVVEKYNRASLDADGTVAVECRAVHLADSKTQEPVLMFWVDGKLKNGAFRGETKKVQEEIPVKQPKKGKPRPPVVVERTVTLYRFGSETATLKQEASVNLTGGRWIPGGRFAFFGEHRDPATGYHIGDVYAVEAAIGQFRKFEGAESELTWFANDGGVAIVDTIDPSGRHHPSALRFGPPDAAKPVVEFPAKGAFGLGGEQSLTGHDGNDRRLMVAAGPGNQLAFTGYVSGTPGRGRFDPDLGRSVGMPGLAGNAWQLFVGNAGTSEFKVVTSEFMRAKASTDGDKPQFAPMGRCTQLQFAGDGTLLFATDGIRTARLDRDNFSQRGASDRFGSGYAESQYAWAWDAKRGVRLLAAAGDAVAVPDESDAKLGWFACGLSQDGRVILKRQANDCVFFTSAR